MKSIRTVVFHYFFVGIAIFFALMILVSLLVSRKIVSDFVLSDHKRSLQYLTLHLENNLSINLKTLEKLAETLSKKASSKKLAEERMGDFIEYSNFFTSIHMYLPDGKFYVHAVRKNSKPYRIEDNFFKIGYGDQDLFERFKQSVQTARPVLSKLYVSNRGFRFQMYMVPVFSSDHKTVKYVLTASIAPLAQDLSFLVSGFQLFEKNFTALFTKEGQMIAASRDLPLDQQKSLGEIKFKFTDGDSAVERLKFGEDSYLLLAKPIPEMGYRAVMGVSSEIVNRKINRIYKYLSTIIVFSVLFCFVVALFLGSRISKPFSMSVAALKQLHLGNFKHRIHYSRNDEIGYLCNLIDRMAEKLEKDQSLGEFWTNDEELEKIKKGEPL